MFSAIKRFASSKNDGNVPNISNSSKPPGLQTMSTSLQKKFARGVQYNSKYIIILVSVLIVFNKIIFQ